jgi:enamine deaminase RidA (YjgF/YER057c/UK114 family)
MKITHINPNSMLKNPFSSQTEKAYKNVLEVLGSVGATQEVVAKQTILVAKGQDIQAGYAAAQIEWGAHTRRIAA